MKKSKSHTRPARRNWLRFSDNLKRKRDRQRQQYDHRRYDGFGGDEALAVEG